MLIKILKKNFSSFIKAQANIKNINSLIKYIHKNHESFSNEDFISAMNKFQELEPNEINPKIKLYDFLDYVLLDQNKLKDNLYLKTVIRIMIGNGLHDKCYWDLIKENLIKNNSIYTDKGDFLYYLKSFSIVEYKESNIWNIFEEFFLEKYFIFELEEIKQIALCFANIQKGTDQFWEKLFDVLDFEESMSIDFTMNFSISLGNYLAEIKNKDFDRKELFVKFLNESINNMNTFIKDYEYDTKQVIYSSFRKFHQIYFSFKLHNFYELKADSFEFLVEELEKLFLNYLKNNVKKLADDDIGGISKILLYFSQVEEDAKLFHFIKYENLPVNQSVKTNKGSDAKEQESSGLSSHKISMDEKIKMEEQGKKDRELVIDAFKYNVDNFTKASQIINFLRFFKQENFSVDKIKEILENDLVWEKIIDEIHLFSIQDLLILSELVRHFNVEYTRLWIFIQTFVRKYFEESLSEEVAKDLELLEKFIYLFDQEHFRLNDYILLQFIYFLRHTKDKLIVRKSHLPQFEQDYKI